MLKKLYWFLFVADLNEQAGKLTSAPVTPWRRKLMKDAAWLLLLSYISLIFQTHIPVLADVLAHSFWEKEHLASEHRLSGQNHVDLTIAKLDKQASKQKANCKAGTEELQHILCCSHKMKAGYPQLIVVAFPRIGVNYSSTPSNRKYPPPRA